MTNNNIQRKYATLLIALEENGGAECQQMPEIYFPEDNVAWSERRKEVLVTKMICKRCPIVEQCLSYALAAKEPWGIWAGTTPEERNQTGNRKRHLRA